VIRAQASFEYLMIVALALGIIVPTAFFFFRYSSDSTSQLADIQLLEVGRTVVNTAERVYYSGSGSKIQIEFTLPEEIVTMYILDHREIVFNISTPQGIQDIVFYSEVNVTSNNCNPVDDELFCDLSEIATPGLAKVRIQTLSNDRVLIESVT